MKTKKIILLAIAMLTFTLINAQKFTTKTGKTEFKASVETFEKVEATNKSTSAILNAENGQVASLLFIRAFNFDVALMEEHFNENYMDSDKFPKATFKGNLKNFKLSELSKETKKMPLDGTLTIKGVKKQINTTASIKKVDNKVIVTVEFDVKPEDFNIKIPNIVRNKISKTIKIIGHYELVKKG